MNTETHVFKCVKCGDELLIPMDGKEKAEEKARESNWFVGVDFSKCPRCAGWVPELNT